MADDNITRSLTCRQCGAGFTTPRVGTPRKFCSIACRSAHSKVRQTKRQYTLRSIDAVCTHCKSAFAYESIGIGNKRIHCSEECRLAARVVLARSQPLCVVDGCLNPRGYTDGICNSCYYRRQRTGTLDRRIYSCRTMSTHGYVMISDPHHPLAGKSYLYEHRKVLYDAIGPGPHPCHWCGTSVDWIKGKCSKGALLPDHLDGVKTNNAIANLVPSCQPCNAARGLFQAWVQRHADDPWLWKLYEAHKLKAA